MQNLGSTILLKNIVQKTNESPNNCQDACASNTRLNRYAVADGVGRSFFPAEWAKLLVECFCNDSSALNMNLFQIKDWKEWLVPIQKTWAIEIQEKVARKTGLDASHLRNSLAQREPAAATFVGLEIGNSNRHDITWQSIIIGDSCLFHIRDNELTSYLMKNPSEFDYHPQYFASFETQNKFEPEFLSGIAQTGDIFILATDALAKWILIQYQSGEQIWQQTLGKLYRISTWNDLYTFIEEARHSDETPMEDDDVAIMIVSVEGKAEQSKGFFTAPKAHARISKPDIPKKSPEPSLVTQVPKYGSDSSAIIDEVQTGKDKAVSKNVSFISVLALIVASISLILSAVSLYISRHETVPHLATSVREGDSTQPIPVQTTITLTSGSNVYSEPDAGSRVIIPVGNETQASLISTSENGGKQWNKIQTDLWVISARKYATEQNNFITIMTPVNARLSPSIDGVLVGKFVPGSVLQKIDEESNSKGKWNKVRVEGYVLGK